MLLRKSGVKKDKRSLQDKAREEGIEIGRKEGLSLGLERGVALGKVQGQYEYMVFLISRKRAKGCSVEETADMLEEDAELVGKVYEALERYDVVNEWEKILEYIGARNI